MVSNNYSATSTPEKVTKANQIFKKSGFPLWVRVGNPIFSGISGLGSDRESETQTKPETRRKIGYRILFMLIIN